MLILSKRAFQGVCLYLVYGGISFAICWVLGFLLRGCIPYFFYKDEVINYVLYALKWIIFILLYGFKYVENWGYLDEYDHIFDRRIYLKQMGAVSGMAMIIPVLTAINSDFIVAYLWAIFYPPHSFLTDFLNEALHSTTDQIFGDSIILGIPPVLILNFLVLMPFYYAGRRHRISDVENKRHVTMTE